MDEVLYKVPLRDLVLTQKGEKPVLLKNKPFEGCVPYLDISALEKDRIEQYTFKELGNLATDEDILVVWDGSRSGLALKSKYGIIGSTLMRLTPVGVDTEYLFYFIKSRYDLINGNLTGGGIPHVDSELFFGLAVPFISIEKQKKIISELLIKIKEKDSLLKLQKEIIKKAFSETEVSYNEGNDISETIRNFRDALLQKAIACELTNSWRQKHNITLINDETSLGSLIVEIKSGKSFRCLERPPKDNEIGVLKISAVSSFDYDEMQSKTCSDKTKINSSLFIKKGDFLFSRANTRELVGTCVIVNETTKKIMLSDKILRITFDNSRVLDKFMLLFLRSDQGRRQIENYATGSQESMKNIAQSDLKSIVLNIPTLTEQNEIVRQVDALTQIANKVQKQYENDVEVYGKLESSILKEAFDDERLKPYLSDLTGDQILSNIQSEKKKLEDKRKSFNKANSKTKSIMKKEVTGISSLDIEEILVQNKKPMLAKDLWKASKYKGDIDAFYEAVKNKVDQTISCEIINLEDSVPESILSLK